MMNKYTIIILALIIIVVALILGVVAVMPNITKQDTNLTIKSNSTINEGDSIKIQLTDANGNILVNQSVNVTLTDSNKTSSYYSVVTNESGFGILKLDKSAGNYTVSCIFGGDDKYKSSNVSKEITINKIIEVETVSKESNQQSYSSEQRSGHYSPQFGRVVYDDEVLPIPY